MSRGRRTMLLVAALVAAGVAVLPGTVRQAVAAGPAPYCSHEHEPGLVTYKWTGMGATPNWTDKANWTRNDSALTASDIPPGGHGNEQPFEPQPGTPVNTSRDTDYVCIPPGSTVVLNDDPEGDSWNLRIQALDVAGTAAHPTTLTMEVGTNLRVFGPQASRPSMIRSGATVVLQGSGLGGPGRIDLDGVLRAGATEADSSGFFTRRCSGEATACQSTPPVRGLLVVTSTGRLLVDGADGVNVLDYYQVRVHGLVRMTDQGYLAADHGTRFELQSEADGAPGFGTLEIRNDGGFYEGAPPAVDEGLAVFVNDGRIEKTGGTGTSVVSASYSAGGGSRVDVRSGTLVLPDGAVRPAHVARGRRYGTASCAYDLSYLCAPVTDPGIDLQAATVRVPRRDRSGALVEVHETAADPAAPTGIVGSPMKIHATHLQASAAQPAVIEIRYDSDILGSQTPATIQVFRRHDGASAYRRVRSCRPDGTPRRGATACIDRGRTRWAPDDADDLIVVIRATATSRWVGR